jgi:hypothetical protein
VIENIRPAGSVRPKGLVEIKGQGLVALPAFVEPPRDDGHPHRGWALEPVRQGTLGTKNGVVPGRYYAGGSIDKIEMVVTGPVRP